jgi:serine/threonine-protein kinase
LIFQHGQVFAGHTIVRLLRRADGAEHYEVRTPEGPAELKVLEATAISAPKPSKRLKQEAAAASMVESVNLVRFLDAGLDDGRVWMLSVFVEGTDLNDLRLAKGGRLPAEDAVRLMKQACEGVAAMHAQNLLHRDIRPENILITAGEIVKVTGLYSVKALTWGVKTTKDQFAGRSSFSAPEELLGPASTEQSDVWSMGCVLYVLLSGRHPFFSPDEAFATAAARQALEEAPPLHTLGPDVPEDLSRAVQRAMARDPAERGTMREFGNRLGEMLSRLTVQRRAAARSVPLPEDDKRLALTEPMPRWPDAGDAPQPAAPVAAAVSWRGGTISMAASSAISSQPTTSTPRDTTRDAVPPAPSGPGPMTTRDATPPPPPSSLVPSTLRSLAHQAGPASAPVASTAPPGARGGTMVMAAPAFSGPVPSTQAPSSGPATSAAPPPVMSVRQEAVASGPARSALPAASVQAANPASRQAMSAHHEAAPSGPVPSALPAPSVQPAYPASQAVISVPREPVPSEPSHYGSGNVLVERSVSRTSLAPRALPAIVMGVVVLVVGVVAAWMLFGPARGPAVQAGVPAAAVSSSPRGTAAPSPTTASGAATTAPAATSAPSTSAKAAPPRPTTKQKQRQATPSR